MNLYGLEVAGAPAFTESAIFIIRSKAFSAAYPWKLSFLGNRVDRATGTRTFANFDAEYWLPDAYLQGGRPQVVKPDAPYVKVWKTRAVPIALFAALLVAVAVVYALRRRLTRRATRKNKWPVNSFKYTAWVLSICVRGFRRDGAAVHHAGANLVPCLVVPMDLGLPHRSLHLPCFGS